MHGKDGNTTVESERLIRLPIWYGIDADASAKVIRSVLSFYNLA
jgi:dTDP-4-amino-4,6-dideoxygalactose transaminase